MGGEGGGQDEVAAAVVVQVVQGCTGRRGMVLEVESDCSGARLCGVGEAAVGRASACTGKEGLSRQLHAVLVGCQTYQVALTDDLV